jgi:long-subunit fatty acid transport protein
MNRTHFRNVRTVIMFAALCGTTIVIAQPSSAPLTIQGLEQRTINGIRSRGMGGTSVAASNDASALYANPAALTRISAVEMRAGGLFGTTFREQKQEWVPYMSNPGLSVLFEGLTRYIPMPLDSNGNTLPPWETLQRQYDDLEPDWDRSKSSVQPLSLTAAVPFNALGIKMTAAIGVAQSMDLDQYYRNNNSLSPYLGQLRPDPKIITKPIDTVHAQWFSYTRERTGIVYGITPGFSAELFAGLSVGFSATTLNGSSDDKEYRVERGHIFIATNNKSTATDFMVDTVYYRQSKIGTSTYSGTAFTLGGLFQQERFSIGVSVTPAHSITRSWKRVVTSLDTTKKSFPVRIDSITSRKYSESGKQTLDFPMEYSVGIIITPTDRWTVAFDYQFRNIAEMKLSSASGPEQHSWINDQGTIAFGAEYRMSELLAFRSGYREDIQAFSPDGSAIIGEPARGSIYSFGTGFMFGNILVDLAYEYSVLKYQDIYQSNANHNTRRGHQMLMEFCYRF